MTITNIGSKVFPNWYVGIQKTKQGKIFCAFGATRQAVSEDIANQMKPNYKLANLIAFINK